jgi:hypothetical protein
MSHPSGVAEPTRRGHRPTGPHPGILALVALLLTLLGIGLGAALSGGAALASPFAATAEVAQRFQQFPLATRLSAWLQVGSAVPLAIAAATFFARQQRLGIRVPGPVIGLVGGVLAATMLMFSGLVGWVLSRPEVTGDATLAHALNFLSFSTGSVGFVVGIGLLIAGLAVPALVLRLLPRWLAWAGLVIAFCAELSFLAMVVEPLQFLFPIGRFLGLLWLVAAGFLLPNTRTAAGQAAAGGGHEVTLT